MRILATTAVLVSGCGTSILLSYPTDVPFLRAHSELVTSTRPLEDPVETAVARIETGPLHVACETTTVIPRLESTVSDTFDGIGRMWCGFMAISEGAIAAGVATNGSGSASTITAAVIGADALGALVYAIVASSSASSHETIGPGLPQVAQTCPDGLVVRAGAQTWAVNGDGSLAGDPHALAQAAVAGQPIAIAGDGGEAAWSPDDRERCALVAQFAIDDPSGTCTAKPVEPAAAPAVRAHVVVPLQLRIRLRRRGSH